MNNHSVFLPPPLSVPSLFPVLVRGEKQDMSKALFQVTGGNYEECKKIRKHMEHKAGGK